MRSAWAISVFLALSACTVQGTVESVLHHPSPNGKLEIEVTRTNYGATVPYVYRFYLKKSGEKIEKNAKEFLRVDQTEGTQVLWLREDLVEIKCLPGRLYEFSNGVLVGGVDIRVELNTHCEVKNTPNALKSN